MKKLRKILPNFGLPRLRFPTELEFEPVQLCNAKCFCCPYTWLQEDAEYRGKKMSREQVELLLTDFGETLKRYGYQGRTTINPFRYSDPLICKDLDLVLALAEHYGLKVQITTNAVSFNARITELLERYLESVKQWITISVIGSTADEVREMMAVDLERTFKKLKRLADTGSPLLGRIRISLRVVSGSDAEKTRLEALRARFLALGVGDVVIKRNWLHNRIEGASTEQGPGHYVRGCNLAHNKLLRRMEVMVNGDVVLCDDDAEGRKVFGNVFAEGIEAIWNGPLKEEHELIFATRYDPAKQDLICAQCTRAQWDAKRFSSWDSLHDIGTGAVVRHMLKGHAALL